jgi:hypothetical protein
VGDGFAMPALIGGGIAFLALIGLLYRRTVTVAGAPRRPG